MELSYLDLAISCIAALLSVLASLGVVFFARGDKKEKRDKIFVFALFFIISLLGGITRFHDGYLASGSPLLLVSKSVTTAAMIWLLALLCFVTLHHSGSSEAEYRPWSITVSVFSAVMSILLLVNCFSPFLFRVGEGGEVLFGKAFFLLPGGEAAMWIVGVVLVTVRRKALCKQDVVVLLVLFAFFATGTALDILFPRITFFSILGILAILVAMALECSKSEQRFLKESAEADRLRNDVSRAKEQLLRSQVSPHFIYNALTAIQALPNNPPATKKAIGDFAQYLRQTLTSIGESKLIPFEKELENILVYCRLEKIRFGRELNIVYEIEEKDFEIPAMSVQILVENAIKHGVSVKRGGGTVRIATKRRGDEIEITITDDGVGFDTKKALDSSHVGINNVNSRISALMQGELTIRSEIGRGTTATIRLPLHRNER